MFDAGPVVDASAEWRGPIAIHANTAGVRGYEVWERGLGRTGHPVVATHDDRFALLVDGPAVGIIGMGIG
jgi:hypothetical protein